MKLIIQTFSRVAITSDAGEFVSSLVPFNKINEFDERPDKHPCS